MTLFTANGLLLGTTRIMTRGVMGSYSGYIGLCYQEWLQTQCENYPVNKEHYFTWLIHLPELFWRRAPGNTCLSALSLFHQGIRGTIEEPINNSKGCGGVMRVAPIGIYFGGKECIEKVDMLGAETAAITHAMPVGFWALQVLMFPPLSVEKGQYPKSGLL